VADAAYEPSAAHVRTPMVTYPMFKCDANENMLKCKLALHIILFHKI